MGRYLESFVEELVKTDSSCRKEGIDTTNPIIRLAIFKSTFGVYARHCCQDDIQYEIPQFLSLKEIYQKRGIEAVVEPSPATQKL